MGDTATARFGAALASLAALSCAALPAVAQTMAEGSAPEAGGRALPHDLSPWSMFLHADAVVRCVMLGLALASVATWALLVGKGAALLSGSARMRRAVMRLAEAAALEEVDLGSGTAGPGPAAALVAAARDEAARSAALPAEGVKERAALSLQRIEARAARGMARGTGVLATVGSVAPFVGLFGTVWGIMDSFVGISQAHTSNLAVVAPGIAEALLATAVGLVAAIPAVVIFNGFARGIANYRALLGDASAEVMRHLSRDLDRRAAAQDREAGPAPRAAG